MTAASPGRGDATPVCRHRADAAVSEWYRRAMALTLRTDDELEHALAVLAETEGLSRQEVIRRAVLDRYERSGHRSRVEQSAERMIDRWGDVLDRLGSV
jgi:predicted transcriptional regulator